MRYRIVAALGVAVLTAGALTPTAADAATGCRETYLPAPAGLPITEVWGMDPSGRYLFGIATPGTDSDTMQPVAWINGHVHVLGIDSSITLRDVNQSGTVIANGPSGGFVWRAGQTTPLPGLHPGDPTSVVAINGRGDIVGASTSTSVVWKAGAWSEPPTVLPTETGVVISPDDIDDNGNVVGTAYDANVSVPYVWRNGGPAQMLQLPAGSEYGGYASQIRNGWISGAAFSSTGSSALRWHLPSLVPTDVSGNSYSLGMSVNNQGRVGVDDGFLVAADGTSVQLPTLGAAGLPEFQAVDRAVVAGPESGSQGARAVLWLGC